jgi:16S rRNA (cytidine1402-2'-O)-methyltransferase
MIADRLLNGESCALLTDAGTPAISDPGEDLVRLCAEKNIPVTAIPGCCAVVNALALSALSTQRFCFEGFLPPKKGRATRLAQLTQESRTIIVYESPHRLVKTLSQFVEVFGAERQVSVCREISKIHEESVRGTLEDVLAHFTAVEPRGEIVIVLAGCEESKKKNNKE